MTTSRELIYASLRKLQITSAGEVPEAADFVDSLQAFNLLMHGIKLEGINLDWRTLGADDPVPLPDEHILAIIYLLAVHLAPDFGREVDPAVATNAQNGRMFLQSFYTDVPDQTFDPALTSRTERWDFDINQG